MSLENPERTVQFEATIELAGVGGHSSVPYKTHNPVNAGFALIRLVQDKVWYEFNSFDNVTMEPVDFAGGIKENIIPDDARLTYYGTCGTEAEKEKLLQILQEALDAIAEGYHVKGQITNFENE